MDVKRLIVTGMALLATSVVAAPAKRAATRATEPSVCTSLMADYESANKKLAMLSAEDFGDNSAIRATMRETQSNNVLTQARMTMDLMKNNGCKGPTSAPSSTRYLSAALSCRTALLKQDLAATRARYDKSPPPTTDYPVECDQSTWKAK